MEKANKLTYQIKENSKLLDALFKNIIDASEKQLLVIADNKLVYTNLSTTKSLGFTSKELKDKLVDELFTANQPVQVKNYISMSVNLRKKEQEPLMLRVICKNGTEKWFIPDFRRCYWKSKSAILLALNDHQNSLGQNETLLTDQRLMHLALRVSHQGVGHYNLKTGESFLSPEFFEMLGYRPNENDFTIDRWKELLHPESLAELKILEKEILNGVSNEIVWEYRIKTSMGNFIWILASGQVVEWDQNGLPIRMVAVHIDIDRKKRVYVEKDEQQNTLKGFIENSLDGLVIVDESGIVKEWNPVQEQITQVKREMAIGKFIWDIQQIDFPDQNPHLNFLVQLKNIISTISHTGKNPWEGKVFETRISLSDGSQKLLQQSVFTIKTPSGIKVATSVRDITANQTVQKRIEKSEERLKLAMSAGNLGIWDVDFATGETYISPMAFTILGYLPWEIEPTDSLWKDLVHQEDIEFVTQKINTLLISGNSNELEFRARKKDGSYIWILSKNRIIRDVYGKNLRVTGTISDITRQKIIEIELRKSKEELTRNIVQHELISDISIILNTSKSFKQKNEEVIRQLGHFTSVSRVYIFENKPDGITSANTYEWCNKGIEAQKDNLQDVPLGTILKWSKGRKYLTSCNLREDLPPDFAELMIQQGIKSFLIFPLHVKGELFGYIGFDECSYERKWEKPEIELLKSISNIIAFSFEREIIQEQYRLNEDRYRELTEKLPQIIFEISVDGMVGFLNQKGCDFFGITKQQIFSGVKVSDLFPPEEVKKIETIRENAISAQELEPVNLTAITANGEQKPVIVYARPRLENIEIVSFSGLVLLPD